MANSYSGLVFLCSPLGGERFELTRFLPPENLPHPFQKLLSDMLFIAGIKLVSSIF